MEDVDELQQVCCPEALGQVPARVRELRPLNRHVLRVLPDDPPVLLRGTSAAAAEAAALLRLLEVVAVLTRLDVPLDLGAGLRDRRLGLRVPLRRDRLSLPILLEREADDLHRPVL